MAKSRVRLSNKSVFTSTRRILHELEREIMDVVECPFLNDEEKSTAQTVYQNTMFMLSLTELK